MLRQVLEFALITTALGSCAVLTVDVDVYKGPLANHEDVQMEQLAVMAIGARPLLVQLRNELEDGFRMRPVNGIDGNARSIIPGDRTCYADELYVSDPACLKSSDAELVNAVLGLYLDQSPPRISRIISEGREIFDRAAVVRAELDDFPSDRALWKRVKAALNPPRDQATADQKKLIDAFDAALNVPKGAKYRSPSELSDLLGDPTTATSANQWFERLKDAAKVDLKTLELLPGDEHGRLRAEVTRRLVGVGELFFEGRQLMDRGLQLSLEFIHDVSVADPAIRNRDSLLDLAIDIAAELIDRKALLAARVAESRNDSFAPAKEFSDSARELADADGAFAELDRRVREWLRKDPAGASSALLNDHFALKTSFKPSDKAPPTIDLKEFSSPTTRRFGIARGLSMSQSEAGSLDRAFTTFNQLARQSSFLGLDDGRLRDGVLTLIENYLRSRNELAADDNSSDSVRLARRKLTDGLTHFAEKILFVVNNDAVLRACKDRQNDAECRESYVMVLESIGNSLLTLNDELHQDWRAAERGSDDAARENRAAQAAWQLEPAAVLDDIIRAILADIAAAQPDLAAKEKLSKDAATNKEAKEKIHTDVDANLTKAKTDLTDKTRELKTATDKRTESNTPKDAWARPKTQEIVQDWNEDECHGSDVSQHARLRDLAKYVESRRDKLRSQRHGDTEDVLGLDMVIERLDSLPLTLTDTPRTPCDVVIGNVTSALDTAVKEADKKVNEATKAKQDADGSVASLTKQEKDTAEAVTKAGKAETEAKQDYDKVAEPLNRKKRAVVLIQQVRLATLEAIKNELSSAASSGMGRQRVRGLLFSTLLNQPSGASPTKAEFESAAGIVATVHLSDIPDVNLTADTAKPTQVLDEVVATLRHELVVANAQGETARAKQIELAIATAESYRSPMVYIRPPASFLRNSSPVTALQDNQLGWTNELTSLSSRAWPFSDPGPMETARLKTQCALDQQFWQRINRVRVTGGGDTTYALVKDDIGNWYVKGYTGDPKRVIQGFTSIALAAGSGAMQADLLDRTKQIDEAKRTGKPIEPKASPTVLGRQVDHFEDNYDDRTEKDAKQLGEVVPKLADEVKSSWKKLAAWDAADALATAGFLKKNANDLEALANEPAKPLGALPTFPKERGEKQAGYCIAALSVAADYERALLERLSEKKLIGDDGLAAKRAAAVTKQSDLATAEANLSVAKGRVTSLEQIVDPTDAVKDQLNHASAERDQIASQVDLARAALSSARAELGDAESKLASARDLVHDMRDSLGETVGVAMQHALDERIDAIEDYQEALQVLGHRPDVTGAAP